MILFPSSAVIIGAICGVVMIYSVEFIESIENRRSRWCFISTRSMRFLSTVMTGLFAAEADYSSVVVLHSYWLSYSAHFLSEYGQQVWVSSCLKFSTKYMVFVLRHVLKKKDWTFTNMANPLTTKIYYPGRAWPPFRERRKRVT